MSESGAIFEPDTWDYVLAAWWVGGRGAPAEYGYPAGDWMCVIYRKKGETQLSWTYRFRYEKDDVIDPMFSDDTKSIWHGVVPEDKRPEIVRVFDEMAEMYLVKFGGKIHRAVIDGHVEKFKAWLMKQKFAKRIRRQ